MLIVTTHEAKIHLARLLLKGADGEKIIITEAGKAIAKQVPIETQTKKRVAGIDRHKAKIADDFEAPLPADLQSFFE